MATDSWREIKIGDLGDVFTGRTPSTERPAYFGDTFPFITPGDMRQGKYARTTERGLSPEGGALLERIRLPADSVCVSCIGWQLGEVILTDRPSFTNQQINSIVPNHEVDPSFLYYSLRPRKQELLALGTMAGVRTPIINKSAFCALTVKVPPLPLQRRIAAVLSAYDDLIENSQQRIAILESMARGLFREWFVHLRFPGHESLPCVPSPFGDIPNGWEMRRIGETFQTVLGGTPSRTTPEFWEGGTISWINSGKVNDLRITEASELITPLALERSAAKLMPKGTTVLAITGATLGQVSYLEIETTANQSVVGIVDPTGFWSEWVYLTISERIDGIINHASGGAQQHINKEIVNAVQILLPTVPVATAFKHLVAPMFREVASLLLQTRVLRRTRDLLLPRIMSGQIDVAAIAS
jgi:type I restriction enzyme S subunit